MNLANTLCSANQTGKRLRLIAATDAITIQLSVEDRRFL
jgi:hypothetical protein